MSNMTTKQVAQLMLGVARSQLAMLDAVESIKAGFKATHMRGILESASRIRSNSPETLSDFPSRLLLQMLGRNPPALDRVAHDLEVLVSGIGTTSSPPSFASGGTGGAVAATGAGGGGAGDADSLDMTTPT